MACERVHQAAINRIPHTYSMICSPTEIVESHCFAVFTLKKSTPLILRLDYWQLMFLEGYWQLGHSSLSELKKRKNGFCPFVLQKGQKKKRKRYLPMIAARTKRLSKLQTIMLTPRGVGRSR
jgi:hypothetical protein